MTTVCVMGDWRGWRGAAAASLSVLAVLSVGGCAAASSAAPPTKPGSSSTIVRGTAASCADLTPSQQFAAAKVVFDGEMLPEVAARGTRGILASPAWVRVERYLKGDGRADVTVDTAIKTVHEGTVLVTEDGIRPRSGERWRIYASTASEPYSISICLGSHRLPARIAHFSSCRPNQLRPPSDVARPLLLDAAGALLDLALCG